MALPCIQAGERRYSVWRALFMLLPAIASAGCATAVRMSNSLDVTSLQERPQPTPPDDYFLWTTRPVTTSIVQRPGGGTWASIKPTEEFIADSSLRRQVVLAYSEPLTTSPPARLRGKTAIRLDGYGLVFVGLQSVAGNAPGGFLGGLAIDMPPLTLTQGTIYATQPFNAERIQDIYPLTSAGTIGSYAPGSVVEFQWVIDQSTRTLSITIPRASGPAISTTYPVSADNVSNSPLPKLLISVWLQQVGPSTNLFLDDFILEEF